MCGMDEQVANQNKGFGEESVRQGEFCWAFLDIPGNELSRSIRNIVERYVGGIQERKCLRRR